MTQAVVPDWVSRYAPEAAVHLAEAESQAATVADPVLLELARLRIAMLLGNGAALERREPEAVRAGLTEAKISDLAHWPTSPEYSATDRACLALTEHFVIDVGGITDDEVAAVLSAIGPAALYGFVQALYLFDMTQRLELGLKAASMGRKEDP